jgi:putative transposase
VFIQAHHTSYAIHTLCRVMRVHRSGYYAWRKAPESARAREDRRLSGLIKQAWTESGGVYGYRKIHDDLLELHETCGEKRVARLMRQEGLRAQVGYARRRHLSGGPPAVVAPNRLQQHFDVAGPDQVWVTDITYIRTQEGWLYLAIVLDLFSRQVVGWSMHTRMQTDLVMQALLMALWRRRPTGTVVVHSDQGSQYTSDDWQRFLRDHQLAASMSRRGNCHDNAVAESFFQLLKRERIKRTIYQTRAGARQDIFDYIELFYNPVRRHGYNGNRSPIEYEKQYRVKVGTV